MKILKGNNNKIAKIWVDDLASVESSALDQIKLMLEFPYLFKHISIMPDTHLGKGAVIGGVVATEKTIVPNIVGVDIGCGMSAFNTNIDYTRELFTKDFWYKWQKLVRALIPVGFNWHSEKQEMPMEIASYYLYFRDSKETFDRVDKQMGTLGGGNHFLEAQVDDKNKIWFMVHSGSRNIGLRISNYYNQKAKEFNLRYKSKTPQDLWFLHEDDNLFNAYLHDMKWATDYALENRWQMLENLYKAFCITAESVIDNYANHNVIRNKGINIHHNFVQREKHFNNDVMVHRKGATSAKKGEIGIIPGSMGTKSYIIRGLGNKDAYASCSHGAGRTMSRTQAKNAITLDDFQSSLEGTLNKADMRNIDEAPGAYKSINNVMQNQRDLVEIVTELTPIITVKG